MGFGCSSSSRSNKLIATKLPEGKFLVGRCGQTTGRDRMERWLKTYTNIPGNTEIVCAADVGLIMHDPEGNHLPLALGDLTNKWVVLSDVDDDAPEPKPK